MIRWLVLGLIGFLAILLVRLPADWFAAQLPPQIRCDRIGGTVWRGDCEGLSIDQGVANRPALRIDALHWSLQPLALLRGRVRAEVQLLRGDGAAQATLTRGAGGLLDVESLRGELRIDRQLLPPLPAGWQGVAHFGDVTLQLDGSNIAQLRGSAELRSLTDATGSSLGNYQLDFGTQVQSPPFKGTLRSSDGPLQMQGQLVLESDTSWVLDGTVAARPDTPESLARMVQMLGPADAAGARPFSIAGAR
jgi:general secretion pathway protein N